MVSRGELTVAASSGPEGDFELVVPSAGAMTLAVVHPDFLDHHEPQASLDPGRTVSLVRGGSIRGVVERVGQGEVAGLDVGLWATPYRSLRGEPLRVEATGKGGEFFFGALRPGIYSLGGYGAGTPLTVLPGIDVDGTSETYVTLVVRSGLTLLGRVTVGRDHRPVPEARVLIRPEIQGPDREVELLGARACSTGPDGRFEVSGLAQGALLVSVGTSWGQVQSQFIDLSGFSEHEEREFVLPEPALVAGRVVDATGEPVAGALVGIVLQSKVRSSGRDVFELALADPSSEAAFECGVQRTASDGTFRLDPAPSDDREREYLVAFPPAAEVIPETGAAAAAGSFPALQVLEQLRPGARLEGVELQLPGAQPLVGRVVDSEGRALSGALVEVHVTQVSRYRAVASTTTGLDGRFALDRPAETSALVEASLEGYRSEGEIVLPAAEDDRDLQLTLEQDLSVRGVVVDPDGLGVEGAYVRLRLQGRERRDRRSRSSETDEYGRFEVDSLREGTWDVNVWADGWEDRGGGDLAVLVPHPEELRIVIEPVPIVATASVAGELVDGETGGPVARLRIDGIRSGSVRVDGLRFVAQGLRPGRQNLVVEARGYEELGLPVEELRPGEHLELGRIQVFRGVDFRLEVRAPTGEHVSRASVRLEPLPGVEGGGGEHRPVLAMREDRSRKRYERDDVARRRWNLVVRHKAYQDQVRIVDLEQASSVRVDLEPKPGK